MSESIREHSLERSLPHSSEAERAILGGVVIDNGLIAQAIELLRPDDFYVPSHRLIFKAMSAVFERGGEINPIIIGEELKKENSLEMVGGISFITNLTYGLPHSTNISHYAKIVRGKSMLRQVIRASSANIQEALEEADEPEVILDHVEKRIYELADARVREGFSHVTPVAEMLLDKIQAMEGRPGVITGLPTGWIEADKMLSGLQKQDLIILAARPSMGKTAAAIMLAENATYHVPGAVVGVFSLEMSKEALVMRLLCAHGNIDAQRFRNGFLSRPEWAQVAKSLGVLSDSKIFLDDTAAIPVLELMAKARRLKAEQKRLDLIVVDFLQLMTGSRERMESRQYEVGGIARGLKAVAKELDVPLVALSQLSRAPELRGDHRPQLSDLRDSGELEQAADVVAFIHRPEVYMNDEQRQTSEWQNIAELIIAKQRNGPTGPIRLRWTPSSMRFDNEYRE